MANPPSTEPFDPVVARLTAARCRGLSKRRFRGEIYDYARSIWLGEGYQVPEDNLCRNCRAAGLSACRHFEIDTAKQLVGFFEAMRDPQVPLVMNLKAVQTLGSLGWDLAVQYFLVHSPYTRIIIYLENDQKAKVYCDSRLMPTLKRNPDIAKFLPTGAARHDETKTDIIFTNGKMIRVCGLNETNASSLSWQVVIVDEGWQHGTDGLIQKAMDRAKQVKAKKLILIGQAGKKSEDQDNIWRRCRQVPLTWACPCCGGRQQFGEKGPFIERTEDFVPLPPNKIQPGSTEWARLFYQPGKELPMLPPAPLPQTYAGLQVPVSLGEITNDEQIIAAASEAYLECYHCGMHLPDTKALRRELMRTYQHDYRQGAITPEGLEVGFWNPEPGSVTVPFRDTMKEYIIAKKTRERTGNLMPMETFFQSRWAKAWDPRMVDELRKRNQTAYDIELAKHDAWRLAMIVDNQKDLMQQWVMVLAVQKDGRSRQLWRGPCMGLAACRAKQLEYGLDPKGNPILKDQHVFLDMRYKPEDIARHIVEHKYGHWATIGGERVFVSWNGMQGSRYEYFTHAEEKDKTKKFIVGDPVVREYQVGGRFVEILVFPFSATSCGQRFEADRDGHGVETLFLEQLPGEPEDTHELSHHAQIHSNKLVESKSFEPRAARQVYVPVPASAPDHYFHMWRMFEGVKEIWLVDGVFAGKG